MEVVLSKDNLPLVVMCIGDDVEHLTYAKKYNVIIREGSKFLLINDKGIEKWYDRCPLCIIEILPLSGEYVEYIGPITGGLTSKGKYYETLDKERDYQYYYFLDDNNRFVGIPKINYFGGKPNFVDVTVIQLRENKLVELGITI
jgi:hypothetical protein